VPIIIEMSLFLLVAVAGYFGVNAAVDAATIKAQTATAGIRSIEEVQAAARDGLPHVRGGRRRRGPARFISLKRGRENIFSPFVLPATMMAAGIGLALQMGYGNPLTHQFWPGPQFAQGILIAAALAAVIIVLPRDPVEITAPVEFLLPFLMLATFIALRLFGKGTEAAPDTLINLGPIQPLEILKLVFVLYLALYFGKRAAKLRFQRDRFLGVDFPRRKVLIPAVLILIALFGAFVMVKDLGATLILSVLFLAMFYIVTRAGGWVLLALAIVAGGVALATHVPAITQSPKVTLRLQMWLDPWLNAIPFGDQTGARALGHRRRRLRGTRPGRRSGHRAPRRPHRPRAGPPHRGDGGGRDDRLPRPAHGHRGPGALDRGLEPHARSACSWPRGSRYSSSRSGS
jgi:hypothetical protein